MTASDIAGITRQYQHRLESMRAVDDLIGQVVAAVEAAGELEHTVIVFTSDNGYLHGEHRMQQKVVAYEESIRVPLFVRLPGGAASIVPQLVINNDLAPTIAELAGVLPGLPVDGLSWLPLIRQPQQEWRRRFLVEHWAATTDLRWDVPTYAAVRAHAAMGVSRDLVYVQDEDGVYTPEFYDLAVDPYQLWSQHGSIDPGRVQLQAWLRAWIAAAKTCQTQTCRVLEFMP